MVASTALYSLRSIPPYSQIACGRILLTLAVLVNASYRTQALEGPPQKPDSSPRKADHAAAARNTTSKPNPAASATAPARCFWDDGTRPRSASAAEAEAHVKLLADVKDMPGQCTALCRGAPQCGDAAFWRVVRDGQAAIPFLIASLDDATPTSAKVPIIGGIYTKADVAKTALTEIVADFRAMELVGIKNPECPACTWWDFVRASPANRKLVKRRVAQWFDRHGAHLVWKDEDFLTSGDCVNDCEHPAGGHYHIATP